MGISDEVHACGFVCVCVYFHGFFFFQAEDGIRDTSVTGVQTCALPIFLICDQILEGRSDPTGIGKTIVIVSDRRQSKVIQIGRASCRERV